MSDEVNPVSKDQPEQAGVVTHPMAQMANLRLGGSDDYSLTVFGGSDSFALAQRMARMLAWSSIVPTDYQAQVQKNNQWIDNPCAIGNCVIAIEIATRLKMSPIMVMQNLDVIHGRPSFRGAFLAALVNQSPLFSRLRYEWKGEAGAMDYGCRAYATEIATGEVVFGAWITWKMVKGEGWDSKTGSKWKTMDEQMFMYRAATFWVRVNSPDLLLGMQTTEELEDITPRAVEGGRQNLADLNARLSGGGSSYIADGAHGPETPAEAAPGPERHAAEDAPAEAAAPARRQRRARAPLEQAEPAADRPADPVASVPDEAATQAAAEPAATTAPADADPSFDVE